MAIDFSAFAKAPEPEQPRDQNGRFEAARQASEATSVSAAFQCFGENGTHVENKRSKPAPLTEEDRWRIARGGSMSQAFAAGFNPESLTSGVQFQDDSAPATSPDLAEAEAASTTQADEVAKLKQEAEELRALLSASLGRQEQIMNESKDQEKARAAIGQLRAEKAMADEATSLSEVEGVRAARGEGLE